MAANAPASAREKEATNKQLHDRAIAIANKIRDLQQEWTLQSRQLDASYMEKERSASSKEERNRLFAEQATADEKLLEQIVYKFQTNLLGEARYVREEILARVPPQPRMRSDYIFETGGGVGALILPETASDLENLARKLSP